MNIDEIKKEWQLKGNSKQASIDMWNSMAQGFGECALPSFHDDRFLQLLQRNQMFSKDSAVLDVGCGTGNYSIVIAGQCKKVVGLDLSPKMIEIAEKKAAENSISNVDFRCLDWHGLDLKQEGYERIFDLVFAHMTPAVQSADTFQKLISAGKGWCALSKPTRRTDPVSDAVKKLIGIRERRESSDTEILFAFELLWQQGFYPYFEYEKQCWHMQKTPDDAYAMYINRMKTYRDISYEEEQSVKRYLQSITKNGLVCEDVDTTVTTLYWHV